MSDTPFRVKKSLVLDPKTSAPADPEEGELYYNSASQTFEGYQGSSWAPLSAVIEGETIKVEFGPSTSTQTWTVPTGVTEITIQAAASSGGGGGGKGGYSGSAVNSRAGGNGGAGYTGANTTITDGSAAYLLALQGGSGGTGSTARATAGSNGGAATGFTVNQPLPNPTLIRTVNGKAGGNGTSANSNGSSGGSAGGSGGAQNWYLTTVSVTPGDTLTLTVPFGGNGGGGGSGNADTGGGGGFNNGQAGTVSNAGAGGNSYYQGSDPYTSGAGGCGGISSGRYYEDLYTQSQSTFTAQSRDGRYGISGLIYSSSGTVTKRYPFSAKYGTPGSPILLSTNRAGGGAGGGGGGWDGFVEIYYKAPRG